MTWIVTIYNFISLIWKIWGEAKSLRDSINAKNEVDKKQQREAGIEELKNAQTKDDQKKALDDVIGGI